MQSCLFMKLFMQMAKTAASLKKKPSAICDHTVILELLNSCDFLQWDGFSGDHPEDIQDGVMFELNAIVNDKQKVRAEGSENFPKHYILFRSTLDQLLDAYSN